MKHNYDIQAVFLWSEDKRRPIKKEMKIVYKYEDYVKSAEYILSKIDTVPKTAIVLGSGLGGLIKDSDVSIPYADIPNFPRSTAPSHEGVMAFSKKAVALKGRFHVYEGYSMEEAAYYVRVLKLIGVKTLILTNASGGINTDFSPGELMLITDHIKLAPDNPLRGENLAQFGTRFPDMTTAYTPKLRTLAAKCAEELDIPLKEGVYAYMSGPCYETSAEIRALRILGADAVGMSTVPEVITARHAGMDILAISCVTNMAAGVTGEALTEEEVIATAEKTKVDFSRLIENITEHLSTEERLQ